MNAEQIIQEAQNSISLQFTALQQLIPYINNHFVATVQHIHNTAGRVVVSGIGKSGIIAQKIVATFNSTGTPSIYLHAADAIHGDLGMVQPNDTIIIISKSGESEEIKMLATLIKSFGNTLIALCGNTNSYLAKQANYILNTTVSKEACPNNLAPTTSTTAQMVMGDALAICLLQLKGFSAMDFAKFHPGGALGKQLFLTVADVAATNKIPTVLPTDTMANVIVSISANRLGATAVVEHNKLLGIITDGDIRRMLQHSKNWDTLQAADIMNTTPKTIAHSAMAVQAMQVLRSHNISQIISIDDEGCIAGFVHIHDLLEQGLQ
jgi:arabinose-5-phosphate isomerase